MKKNLFRTFALLAGAALASVAGLHAADVYSTNVSIPFAFRVGNLTMPAGTYRIERTFGSQISALVNTGTGRGVQLMFMPGMHRDGKLQLTFENDGAGNVLKGLR